MPPKREIIQFIKDEHHFQQLIDPENKKLIVLDVHPQWSGPCEMMYPTYKALTSTIDDFDKRVEIIMCDLNKLGNFKHDKFNMLQTSKPRFAFLLEGKFIDEIQGADIPQMEVKIKNYLPMIY